MEKYLYIDGDILLYRVGFKTQRTWYKCAGLETTSKREMNAFLSVNPDAVIEETFEVDPPLTAWLTMKESIAKVVGEAKAAYPSLTGYRFVMSGEENFRDDIATIQPYKGNRDGAERPVHYQHMKDMALAQPTTILSEGEEADDVLSKALMEGHVCCTADKDLLNTPGQHFHLTKKEAYVVTPAEAARNFYRQTLMGDTADNIPGLKGIGPAKADIILGPHPVESRVFSEAYYREGMETQVLKCFQDRLGCTKAEALQRLSEVGRLLWMRRTEGEVWTPITDGGEE